MSNKLIKKQYFIIDFDSTFISIETLDELAKIALNNNPDKDKILKEITDTTKLGMAGKISFTQSLNQRLKLFSANKEHIQILLSQLEEKITPSLLKNSHFPKQFAKQIYIISGGFKEYIVPIVMKFGIAKDHVLANTFIYDKQGNITGFDAKNPLSQANGKAKAVKKLGLKGEVIVIGDGYTDYQIKEQRYADQFFAFTEHVSRPEVIKKADKVIANFDELLYYFSMPRALSYPKTKIKALLLEGINKQAVDLLKQEGYEVELLTTTLAESELSEKIKDISLLGIRSKTNVTKKVLESAKKLLAIGVFGIGVNQVDIPASSQKGVAIFNAPFSSTRSVAELAMGDIIMLYRKAFDKSMKLHNGVWDKSATNCHEVRGKKLGIIGYGNIGMQISVIAESFGMHVYFYDLMDKPALGNAHKCSSLDELLKVSDVVTVHSNAQKGNKYLIGEKEFKAMKDGVIFLNLSRASVVDTDALVANIKSGKVAGAAVDVFSPEPKSNKEPFNSVLQGLPNIILTPHLGGSTEEAQRNIGDFVANKLITFVNTGDTMMSVNFPNLLLPAQEKVHRIIHIHKNVPGVLAEINNLFAKHKINVEGQYLKTNETIGYVITDVNKATDEKLIEELKAIPQTIRVRILY